MPTLRLNGIEVPALIDGASVGPFLVRDDARGPGGGLAGTERVRKREWRFRTKPLRQADAEAWRGLIAGLGHVWKFDADFFSAKALGPLASSGDAHISGGAKFGSYARTAAIGGFVEFAALTAGSPWTLARFMHERDGGGWVHWVSTSAGEKWLNGAASSGDPYATVSTAGAVKIWAKHAKDGVTASWAASTAYALGAKIFGSASGLGQTLEVTTAGTSGATQPTWSDVLGATHADGTVVWTNRGRADLFADDLVVLPYVVPSAWVSELYAWHNANPWSALPRLRADGDIIRGGPIDVIGRVEEIAHVPFHDAGAWTPGGESFAFRLLEC